MEGAGFGWFFHLDVEELAEAILDVPWGAVSAGFIHFYNLFFILLYNIFLLIAIRKFFVGLGIFDKKYYF